MEKLIHKMEKLGFGLDDDRLLSIKRCIIYLVHACQCRDVNCMLPSCQKMKRVVKHSKSCKLKAIGGCPICRQLIALSCYHAKHCQEAKCPVSYCSSVKNKMKHQQLQLGLQQAQILKRRIATMQNRRMSSAVLQTSPNNSNFSNQPSPGADPHSSPDPPQPDIGMKPSTAPPSQPTQLMGSPNNVSNSIGNSAMGPPQVMPNPGSFMEGMQRTREAWQQLLETLKSPPSAQQQQQVLGLLKSNPQLMAAFIKQRTAQQQQQQQLMLLNEGKEAECPVSYCSSVKNKMNHQRLQQRLQQAQILKRRIATMQMQMQNHRKSSAVLQTSPNNSNFSNQPSPGADPHSSPDPPQPDIGMEPSTAPPSQPTQLMGSPNNVSNSIGNSAMGPPQVMPNPGSFMEGMLSTNPAWQQLLETLKSPPSPQQQQQVLGILKSNPQLMAAFIKQRTAQQQQQQQLMQLNEGIHNLNISK